MKKGNRFPPCQGSANAHRARGRIRASSWHLGAGSHLPSTGSIQSEGHLGWAPCRSGCCRPSAHGAGTWRYLERNLRNKATFPNHCCWRLYFGNPVLAGTKERDYLNVYTQQTKTKTKTTPTLAQLCGRVEKELAFTFMPS